MENRDRIAGGVCGLLGQLLEMDWSASRHWVGCIMVEG
jgi:hypothetical protein